MSKKKTIKLFLGLLKIGITLGIFYLIFKHIDMTAFKDTVRNANFVWIVGAWCFMFAMMVPATVFRWQLLLEGHGIHLSFFRILQLHMVGTFFNTFLPGGTGGDLVKAYYVARDSHHKKPEAIATIVADRIIGVFSLLAMGFCAMLTQWQDVRFRVPSAIIFAICCGLLGFCTIFLNKAVLKRMPFADHFHANYKKLPMSDAVTRAYDALVYYKDHKRYLVRALVYSIILQLGFILAHPIMAKGLNLPSVGIGTYVLLVPIGVIVAALPVSIQGWGVGEAAYIALFGLAGMESTHSLALSLLMRMTYVILGVTGGIFYLTLKDLVRVQEISDEQPDE